MAKCRFMYVCPVMIALTLHPARAFAQHYNETVLVSDSAGVALTDPNLKNAWGVVHGPTTPWWVSNNATGTSTIYNASTNPVTPAPLIVTIPAAPSQTGTGSPTGIVFNGNPTDFLLAAGKPASFIWVTEDGTVSAWNSGVDPTHAIIKVDNSQKPSPADGAVYKGAAIVTISGNRYLLATNFRSGHIDAFDTSFRQVTLDHHAFEDERIPRGYAPFNVEAVGPNVFVTYAKQDPVRHDDVAGAGFGYVVVYSQSGDVIARLEHGAWLNSPWGIVVAPADFGSFSHAVLIGNFGDGSIAAFNPITGHFIGNVLNPDGSTLKIDGLWGLSFGNGGASGPGSTLFFTAGPNGETDGLFGTLTPVPAELSGAGQ